MTLFEESNVEDIIQNPLLIGEKRFYVYGDSNFVMRPWIQVGYSQTLGRPNETMYNAAISSSQQAVEWS